MSNYFPNQGELVGFTLYWADPEAEYELVDEEFAEPIETYRRGDDQLALIPIVTSSTVGVRYLDVVEIRRDERRIMFTLEYTVQNVNFTRQDLTATTEMSSLLTDDNRRHDQEKIAHAKSASVPYPLWHGLFIQPVEGRISTEFGQVRYTNGVYSSRHDAIDIAIAEGTEIAAPAAGRVVLAEHLFISGNAVYIDHGMWLFTSYLHMHEIFVSVGDEVKAGDIIGTVGTTGYSTGPHLHYQAAIRNQNINPDHLKEILLFE